MDKQQEEMKFLGFFGIYNESRKLIYSHWKIFSKITLTLILPLSFVFLSHLVFSHHLYTNIAITEIQLGRTSVNTPHHRSLKDHFISELAYYILFEIVCLAFYVILSLLSTSLVAYTVACIFTSRNLTFKSIINVVPKVWKRLMITLLCISLALIVFNAVAVAVAASLITIVNSVEFDDDFLIIAFLVLFWTTYAVGFVYLMVVSNLACVLSVLEEMFGFSAMVKSRMLIRGKVLVTMAIFLKIYLSFFAMLYVFQWLVVDGFVRSGRGWRSVNMLERVSYAVVCFLLFSVLKLFELVIQTLVYFVCKSYHHESIDKIALSKHLEVYLLGEHVPLKGKDVQLEVYHV